MNSNFDYQIFSSPSSLYNKSETNVPFFNFFFFKCALKGKTPAGRCREVMWQAMWPKQSRHRRLFLPAVGSCVGVTRVSRSASCFGTNRRRLVWHNVADEPPTMAEIAALKSLQPSLVKDKNLDLICELIYRHVTTVEHVLLCENLISRPINRHDLSMNNGWNMSKHQNALRKWDFHPHHNITW